MQKKPSKFVFIGSIAFLIQAILATMLQDRLSPKLVISFWIYTVLFFIFGYGFWKLNWLLVFITIITMMLVGILVLWPSYGLIMVMCILLTFFLFIFKFFMNEYKKDEPLPKNSEEDIKSIPKNE